MVKKKTKAVHISGRVLDQESRRGAAGLRVEAWDKDMICDDVIGHALTDELGAFQIELDELYLKELFLERRPELLFKVFRDETLLSAPGESVSWNPDIAETEIIIEVVTSTPKEHESGDHRRSFVVKGQIRQADSSPFVGAVVRAFDKDLRSEQFLGEAVTDREGRYQITYTPNLFRRAEKKSADVIVRVYGRDEQMHASSEILFNAPLEATVDLVVGGGVYRGPSEYEQLVTELEPILEGVKPTNLTEADVAFLAGETGIASQEISFLANSARHAEETGLPPEVFYGFARENMPTDLPALLAQNPQAQRRALERAYSDNLIPPSLRDQMDAILAELQHLILKQAFKEPDQPGQHSLSAVLSTGVPSVDIQEKFLTQYVQHDGPMPHFWQALRADPSFGPQVVADLQFTIQVTALTRDHLPLIETLQRLRQEGILTSFRDLSKLNEADWRSMIDQRTNDQAAGFPPDVPGANDTEKAMNYARTMLRTVEQAFPTTVIANRLAQDSVVGKEDLTQFFSNSPDFDFGKHHVDIYLADNPSALTGVTDPGGLTKQLKSIQRVFKLTPRYDEIHPLLADGLDSAQRVTQMGMTAFVAKYSQALGGTSRAQAIYGRAQQVAAMALILFSKYAPAMNSIDLAVTAKLSTLGG